MKKTSFIFLAKGFEEVEATTIVDVMRRADLNIKMVSITDSLQVTGSHSITLTADCLLNDTEFDEADWLICPGGMPGSSNLASCEKLSNLLKGHYENGGKIAAICAAPSIVLAPLGILDNKRATCYPGFEEHMTKTKFINEPVVTDGTIITANGPSAAMQFALAIVSVEEGEDLAYDTASGMLLYPQHHQYYF